jgi:hypothetical protein
MATTAFIAELIRAANEPSKLSHIEAILLLRRTAASIRDSRDQVAFRSSADDPGQGDIVFELTIMATSIDLFPREKVAAMLLEAAQVLKANKILLDAKNAG